jgi:hypothetical protein
MATASASGDICVWSPENGQLIRRMVSRGGSVAAVGWSPDGRAVAWSHSSSTGSVIKGTVPLQHSFCLAALDFGPPPDASFVHSRESYGDLHIERTSNFVVSVWRSGRLLSQYRLTHLDDRVRCRSILSGQRAVVGSDYGTVVFDANTGRAIYGLPGHTDSVWAISPSPNNRYLLTGSHDQTLEIWNTDTYEHLLSLFFCGSEWIVWSPKGYYAASVGGERLMGWHINRDPDTLADYFPAANFHDSLYRPDVIRRLIEAGSFKAAWQQADEERERRSEPQTIAAILPPTVTVQRIDSDDESTDSARISATATPSGKEPMKRLRVIVDGRPGESYTVPPAIATDSTGSASTISHEFAVPLTPGEHTITVKADTGASFGLSLPLKVATTTVQIRKPKLYVRAIGAGTYADSSWRIDRAADDASAIARRLGADKSTIYSAIETQVLTGGQATRANVLAALEAMRQKMTPADVGVVFLEGRGGNDAGTERSRFFTADSQRSVTGGGISSDELKQFVERTPGRLMIWADIRRASADTTRAEVNHCESQMAASHQNGGFALYDFLRELADADHGAVVMGTTGQVPDSSKPVGTFAEAILAGLSAEADTDANGTVSIGEFESAVRNHVSAASDGRQRTIQSSPADVRSFPLIAP